MGEAGAHVSRGSPRLAITAAPFDRYLGDEALIAGSPRTVRQYVERWGEPSGCNYWVSSFRWGDLTHTEASESLGRFIAEVRPALD